MKLMLASIGRENMPPVRGRGRGDTDGPGPVILKILGKNCEMRGGVCGELPRVLLRNMMRESLRKHCDARDWCDSPTHPHGARQSNSVAACGRGALRLGECREHVICERYREPSSTGTMARARVVGRGYGQPSTALVC